MQSLDQTAPRFVEMAHRIVWATVATTAPDGHPWTRVLHPLWTWDGVALTGIVATAPTPLKRAHLAAVPFVSVTYWDPTQDTCTAQCRARWDMTPAGREAGWEALRSAPPPVGYDPAIIPGWDEPTSADFAILVLEPTRLRVMPGSVLLQGVGDTLVWSHRA